MTTWIVGGVLVILVAAIVWKMIRDNKAGKGGCGGECSRCHGSCNH